MCKQHNVILIADEVQTGLGRTGKMMCYEHYGVKPDMITVGKALSGGLMPVSGVLTSSKYMDVIRPGDHGSTYGGSAIACATAKAALEVIEEEGLVENSRVRGDQILEMLKPIEKFNMIKEVRGKGLFIAIETATLPSVKVDANDLAHILIEEGILAKSTHETTLRIAPYLGITEKEAVYATKRVIRGVNTLAKLNRERRKE